MKKIFFIFLILPFSVFAELTRDDLYEIEYQLGKIEEDISTIEPRTADAVTHLTYIRQICAEILSTLNTAAIGSQLEDLRNKLSGISNRAQIIIDKLNEFLPQIKTELTTANTSLGLIETEIIYLNDRLQSFQSETYDWLQSIDYKLTDIKTAITDGFENINNAMTSLQTAITTISTTLSEINSTTQNIYTELLSQGLDINSISTFLKQSLYLQYNGNSLTLRIPDFSAFDQLYKIGIPFTYNGWTYLYSSTSTNLINRISQNIEHIVKACANNLNYSANSLYRLYDIQTNFYSSIKLQKDISTNVAYIASVITNSHDLLKLIASNVVNIARHTMPTNIADQYETQQQEGIDQISSSFQDHENDMSQFESQLTRLPAPVQNRFDDGANYISRLSSSNLSVDRLDDEIFSSLPDYHSSLANRSFSLPITTKLTPDAKQIFAILRKCVTTTIWFFTFLFTLFMIQKFLQFVSWIMSLLNPITRDVFGNTSSGSLYRLMGG